MVYQTGSISSTDKPRKSLHYDHVNTYTSRLINTTFDIRVRTDGAVAIGFPYVGWVIPQRREDGSNVTRSSASLEDAARILRQLLVMTGIKTSPPPLDEILEAEKTLISDMLSDLSRYRIKPESAEQVS